MKWQIYSRYEVTNSSLRRRRRHFLLPCRRRAIWITLLYYFTRTRHLTLILTLALPMCIRFILFGWIKNTNHIFVHLLPQSTPTIVIPFIVIIETISNLIRSGTLAVRLTANIIAGHLLLTLLGNNGPSIKHY